MMRILADNRGKIANEAVCILAKFAMPISTGGLPQLGDVLVDEIVGDHHTLGCHVPKLNRDAIGVVSEREFAPQGYDIGF